MLESQLHVFFELLISFPVNTELSANSLLFSNSKSSQKSARPEPHVEPKVPIAKYGEHKKGMSYQKLPSSSIQQRLYASLINKNPLLKPISLINIESARKHCPPHLSSGPAHTLPLPPHPDHSPLTRA